MDRKAWSSTVREAAESQTTLSTSIYLYLQLINVVLVSGGPCPPPGDLPDPGIEPLSLMSPALAGGFFTYLCHLGTPYTNYVSIKDIS